MNKKVFIRSFFFPWGLVPRLTTISRAQSWTRFMHHVSCLEEKSILLLLLLPIQYIQKKFLQCVYYKLVKQHESWQPLNQLCMKWNLQLNKQSSKGTARYSSSRPSAPGLSRNGLWMKFYVRCTYEYVDRWMRERRMRARASPTSSFLIATFFTVLYSDTMIDTPTNPKSVWSVWKREKIKIKLARSVLADGRNHSFGPLLPQFSWAQSTPDTSNFGQRDRLSFSSVQAYM